MTPQDELERLVDLSGLENVMAMLSVICAARAYNLARHDASAAKVWDRQARALDSAIVKMWGRL
jgi:hypothetical protein